MDLSGGRRPARRPSIHRQGNQESNLTDDQKQKMSSDSVTTRDTWVKGQNEGTNVEVSDDENVSCDSSYDTTDSENGSLDSEDDDSSEQEEEFIKIPAGQKGLRRRYSPRSTKSSKKFFLSQDRIPNTVFDKVLEKNSASERFITLWECFADEFKGDNKMYMYMLLGFFLCMIPLTAYAVLSLADEKTEKTETFLTTIKKKFPSQDEFLWIAFEAGVEDVVLRNRPSTFILLYKEEAEETLTDLVHQLSKYAACHITDCEKKPIELTPAQLNSPAVVRDYGIIIEEYRDKLKENGVMIIKNLERVRGISAQAFHSFCDEFTPLVDKSLFIFTMKVKELPKNQMEFIENYFRTQWTEIKMDTLNALITRITSMVLEIKS